MLCLLYTIAHAFNAGKHRLIMITNCRNMNWDVAGLLVYFIYFVTCNVVVALSYMS